MTKEQGKRRLPLLLTCAAAADRQLTLACTGSGVGIGEVRLWVGSSCLVWASIPNEKYCSEPLLTHNTNAYVRQGSGQPQKEVQPRDMEKKSWRPLRGASQRLKVAAARRTSTRKLLSRLYRFN